jgi:hypothetical protein
LLCGLSLESKREGQLLLVLGFLPEQILPTFTACSLIL